MTSVIPTVTCFIIKCEPRIKEELVHPSAPYVVSKSYNTEDEILIIVQTLEKWKKKKNNKETQTDARFQKIASNTYLYLINNNLFWYTHFDVIIQNALSFKS